MFLTFIIYAIFRLYSKIEDSMDENSSKLTAISQRAKEYHLINRRIQELKSELSLIEKFTIKIETIEMTVDKLPTAVLFFSFLFASFENDRMKWVLGGNGNGDNFYVLLLFFSFASSIFGIISICMKIR